MSSANPPIVPVGLTPANLTLPKEGTYFTFVLILSILFWLVIAITIVGLFYALIIGFFLWFGNGLLIAHLRSESVRVDERQLPELYATFRQVCQQLGVTQGTAGYEQLGATQTPALYVVQSGGIFNAFATRFSGRDFVVVYSDFLEALGPTSPEMKFILGHELGHIKSRHILKQLFLGPGMLSPLIGPAYRRAWESSCDRYGAFAAQDVEGSLRAMMILSGGKEHGRTLSAEAFAGQHVDERGFFVSLHELTATYPTSSRRVSDLLTLRTGQPARKPDRNPFAYFVALFMPGGHTGRGGGGLADTMIVVVIIGLLAAMAIPAFQKVRESSINKVCINNQRQLAAAFEQSSLEAGKAPTEIGDLIGTGPGKYIKTLPVCPKGGSYQISEGATTGEEVFCTVHGTIRDIQEKSTHAPTRH